MNDVKIPEGYKQTEVGIIPEDWDSIKVQDVCDFIVPGRNKPQKFDGDIPWITTPDLIDGRAVFFSRSGLKISKEVAKTVGSKIVPAGSVIMSCVGELGLVAIAGVNIVINQQLHAFLPSEKIDNYFLMYALKDQESYFYGAATKTALPYLNKDNCNATPLPLPSIQEQTTIATALSNVDNLIQSLEKLIAKKEAIKTGTMQQLLTGKTRLPKFATRVDGNPKGFKQTELGQIPEDWGFNKLDSLSEVIDPHPSHRAPAEFANGIPFLGIGDINERGEVIKSNFRKVGSYVLEEHAARYRLGEGLIGLGRVASIGKVIIFNDTLKNCTISPTLGLIRPRNINLNYLGHFLKSEFIINQFRQVMSGSTRSSVGMIVLRKLIILTPSKKEQTAIATILSDMDAEIQALQQRLEKTKDIKQGMMQQLLTGKVRLAH